MNAPSLADVLIWNWTFWSSLSIYSLACIGIGLALLRATVGPGYATAVDVPPLVLLGVSAAVGLGFLGQLWTLLALVGYFRKPPVQAVIVGALIALAVWVPPLRRGLCAELKQTWKAFRSENIAISL